MYTDLTTLCISPTSSIRDAIALMDVSRIGIVLVVDCQQRLIGTVTDGDVRRAFLANISFDASITVMLEHKAGSPHARPITAAADSDQATILRTLQDHRILHLPLVDQENRVVALAKLDEFVAEAPPTVQAVIMAGGLGTRLRPLTEDVPKPMLLVGDRPLIEITVQQLRAAGIKRVNVAVHHKAERITEHLGDGQRYGVDIRYLTEDQPLGTAGALAMMGSPRDTTLVINGDVLTQVDFRVMLGYHREHGTDLTLAVHRYDLQVPYGVVECDGTFVRRLVEKPLLKFFVNAGIYLLEPAAFRLIPSGEKFDMTDLIQRLVEVGRPVAAFPVMEYWLDIGQATDFQQAQEHVETWNTRP